MLSLQLKKVLEASRKSFLGIRIPITVILIGNRGVTLVTVGHRSRLGL